MKKLLAHLPQRKRKGLREVLGFFPCMTGQQNTCFDLLSRAYIYARYKKVQAFLTVC